MFMSTSDQLMAQLRRDAEQIDVIRINYALSRQRTRTTEHAERPRKTVADFPYRPCRGHSPGNSLDQLRPRTLSGSPAPAW
jgi:hypothetical protein